MSEHLTTYLRDHEAAARAGRDLFRRAARSQRRHGHGEQLGELAKEVAADLNTLHHLMAALDVSPQPLLGTALRLGERLGRLKPNGSWLRRTPLTDLFEVEALLDAVRAKAAGWAALQAAGFHEHPEDRVRALLNQLSARAESQLQRLQDLHQSVASAVLAAPHRRP